MELRRFLLTTAVVVVVLLTVLAWFYPAGDDFRTDNPFWNGVKNISPEVPFTPLYSLSRLSSLPDGSTLILIPYLECTALELDELYRFVARGATLVIADDYGHGNQVLSGLGISARFSGQVLLDPLVNYRNAWFPRIYRLSSSPVMANIDSLVFNHATALTGVSSANALAWSSSASFLDRNNNSRWDGNESTGPFPVISQHVLGNGQVILISDPSILIRSMQGVAGNGMLLRNIAARTESGLYIDDSHLPKSNLNDTKNVLISVRNYLATPLGTLGLVTIALAVSLFPLWYRKGGQKGKSARRDVARQLPK